MMPLTTPFGNRPANPSDVARQQAKASIAPRERTEAGLRRALTKALGADEKIFTDPMGARVAVGQAIVDHMLVDLKARGGREAFFPFIPELIEDPAEIWIGFAKNEVSGRTFIRRRYVSLLDLGRGRALGMVADLDGNEWAGVTFFPSELRGMANMRTGLRVYRRGRSGG